MTTFGEITEPGSRNVWEDWDEIQDENTNSLQWQKEMELPSEIKTLLILEGKYLSDCIKIQNEFKLEHINTVSEVNLHLYRTNALSYVCVLKDYNLVMASEIVELMRPIITISKDVVAILTQPLVEYQVSELTTQDCVVRSLNTSKPVSKSLDINFPKLEQPNIISGVSAGVIYLRENLDLPAAAVVCYIEQPEENPANELHNLLEKLSIIPIQAKTNSVFNSNLYI